MLQAAAGPRAEYALAVVSFCCSIFFPIPQDVMLVPMCLSLQHRAFRYASIAVLASVAGGIVAYALGYFAYQAIALPILHFYGHSQTPEIFNEFYNRYGWLIVFAGGMTPIPYKIIAVLSGASGLFLPTFIAASLMGRIVRFFSIALLIYLFGNPIKAFIEKYFPLCTIFLVVAIIGGFLVLNLM